MGEELGVKCSNCGNNGHDSGTCSERVALKLFGFKIFQEKREEESMKKSFSVENLQASVAEHGAIERGYLSDGPLRSRRDRNGRKKGVPWTEEEHRTFLLGLKKLGKGDWRGISRNFVTTRTPTQVASHAQKYFLRQTTNNKKKRRSSLFDMPVEDPNIHSSQSASLMAAPRLEVPQAKTVATDSSGTNAHHGMPCRERLNPEWRLRPSEAKLFPAMPFGNAAVFAHKSYKNFIVSHSPVNAVRNQSFPPSCATKMEAGSSSTTNTELELTIAPPEVHDRTKLLNGASKMGGVIRVI